MGERASRATASGPRHRPGQRVRFSRYSPAYSLAKAVRRTQAALSCRQGHAGRPGPCAPAGREGFIMSHRKAVFVVVLFVGLWVARAAEAGDGENGGVYRKALRGTVWVVVKQDGKLA